MLRKVVLVMAVLSSLLTVAPAQAQIHGLECDPPRHEVIMVFHPPVVGMPVWSAAAFHSNPTQSCKLREVAGVEAHTFLPGATRFMFRLGLINKPRPATLWVQFDGSQLGGESGLTEMDQYTEQGSIDVYTSKQFPIDPTLAFLPDRCIDSIWNGQFMDACTLGTIPH